MCCCLPVSRISQAPLLVLLKHPNIQYAQQVSCYMPQNSNSAAPLEPVAMRLLATAESMPDNLSVVVVMVAAIQVAENRDVRNEIALRMMRFIKTIFNMDDVEIVVRRDM